MIQFRATGTYTWTANAGVTSISRLLVVGGGGSGGARGGGGGGAGGYVYKTNVAVTPRTSYSVVIGELGSISGNHGANGGDSSFNNTVVAKGGGGGATGAAGGYTGWNGGSGGGALGDGNAAGVSNQRTSGDASGLGFAGGTGTSTTTATPQEWLGGGGGGSGSAGTNAVKSSRTAGNGGAGTLNDITGEYVCYAAGGGGGSERTAAGGPGKGGTCTTSDSATVRSGGDGGRNADVGSMSRLLNATQFTGSGGGGGGWTENVRNELGGAGGRGIVVIRYTLPSASLDLNAANYTGSGTTWTDASGTGNNGTLQNAPTFTAATATDPAHFKFDGTKSQYVSTAKYIPSSGPLNFSGGVWFRTSSNLGAKILGYENVQTGTGTGSYDRHLYVGTDSKLYWGICDTVDCVRTVNTPTKVNDGKWHYAFFTSTWTYGGNIISLSLDNGPALSLSTSGRPQDFGGWWRLGSYQMNGWTNGRTGYYTGDIARATLYPWVLSPEAARSKYLDGYSPVKISALASTTSTGINVTWDTVTGATGYNVNIYNSTGLALVKSIAVGDVASKVLSTADGISANTGYRISVTANGYAPAAGVRRTVSNESAKSELVVAQNSNCAPTQSISGPYTILKFNSASNKTSSCAWTAPTLTTPLEYLVVGGGGGGGQNSGGGGQGGYYNAGTLTPTNASGKTFAVTVGAGGAGGINGFNNTNLATTAVSSLRNGVEGDLSALTSTSNAIVASGGAGGLTVWESLVCSGSSTVSKGYHAKLGTPVVGRQGAGWRCWSSATEY